MGIVDTDHGQILRYTEPPLKAQVDQLICNFVIIADNSGHILHPAENVFFNGG